MTFFILGTRLANKCEIRSENEIFPPISAIAAKYVTRDYLGLFME
jgi:hypothetical protein